MRLRKKARKIVNIDLAWQRVKRLHDVFCFKDQIRWNRGCPSFCHCQFCHQFFKLAAKLFFWLFLGIFRSEQEGQKILVSTSNTLKRNMRIGLLEHSINRFCSLCICTSLGLSWNVWFENTREMYSPNSNKWNCRTSYFWPLIFSNVVA